MWAGLASLTPQQMAAISPCPHSPFLCVHVVESASKSPLRRTQSCLGPALMASFNLVILLKTLQTHSHPEPLGDGASKVNSGVHTATALASYNPVSVQSSRPSFTRTCICCQRPCFLPSLRNALPPTWDVSWEEMLSCLCIQGRARRIAVPERFYSFPKYLLAPSIILVGDILGGCCRQLNVRGVLERVLLKESAM